MALKQSYMWLVLMGVLLICIILRVINTDLTSATDCSSNKAPTILDAVYRPLPLPTSTDSTPRMEMNNIIMGTSKAVDYRGLNYHFFVFKPNVDNYVSRSMIDNGGVWEHFLNDLINFLVKKETEESGSLARDLLVMDCGANLGAFTLYAASLGVSVMAFEMQKLVYTLLEMSVRVSGFSHHVNVYNVPLWNQTMNVSYNEDIGNYGGVWMRQDKKGTGGKMLSIRLDSLPLFQRQKKVFFMKMDMEGAEERALRGFDSVIEAHRVKHIAVGDSVHNHLQLYQWLYSLGYRCRNFGPASTSSLNADCTNLLDNQNPACNFEVYNGVKSMIEKIRNGHVNMLCSLSDW